jgi:hypothetical protein
MRKYSTAYPVFDEQWKIIELFILSHILNGGHPPKTVTVLNKLHNEVEKARELLVQHPSLNATNLGQKINELYKKDPTAHAIIVEIQLVENPKKDRYSREVFLVPTNNEFLINSINE